VSCLDHLGVVCNEGTSAHRKLAVADKACDRENITEHETVWEARNLQRVENTAIRKEPSVSDETRMGEKKKFDLDTSQSRGS